MSYCTRADVYALGLSAEAFVSSPRLVEGVTASSGMLKLTAHGLVPGAPITLAVQSGAALLGMPASSLPGGLAEGVTYYAQPLGSDTLQVSTTVGGVAVKPFSNDGVGIFGVCVDHVSDLDAAIAGAGRLLEAHLTAHKGPVGADVVRDVAARLAVRIYVSAHGLGNAIAGASYEAIEALRFIDERLMQGWLAGRPLPAGSVDATPAVSEMGAALVDLDTRGFLEGNRV